jgi:hypothetical protein
VISLPEHELSQRSATAPSSMDESLYHIETPLGWGLYQVVEGCDAGAADGTLMGSVTGLRDLGTEGWCV